MVFTILAEAGLHILILAAENLEDAALEDLRLTADQQAGFTWGIVIMALSIPAAVIYQLWQRSRPVWLQRSLAAVLVLAWLIVCINLDASVVEAFLVVVALGFIYLEAPSMLRWAGATVVRSLTLLGPMVAHVLPFLLLAQLLVFFTEEMWGMAYSFSKARMWAVCGLLFAPTVMLTWSQSSRALKTHLDHHSDGGPLLRDTPFAEVENTNNKPLRLGERINLALLPTIAQLIQVLLFVGIVFAFFLAFGSVALTPELISKWTGHPPIRMIWLGISLPIDLTMFRVSMMLAVFSGLSFAASNATDGNYREMFLAPIVDNMERGLAARHRYLG